METSTQFQNNNSTTISVNKLDTNVTQVVRKATPLSISTSSIVQSNVSSIAIPSGVETKMNIINTTPANTNNITNLIAPSNTANAVSNGQATPTQQIIQVSSQGAIIPGQQLMVQTLSGRPAIQLRPGQQFQQIQLIPFGNIQGQNQRPVIIQQTPGNVQLHSSATTITSMANLAHNNIGKLASGVANTTVAHQKPVIIQQAATGQFIHSANPQSHALHGHSVTKIATVGRAAARPNASQQGKMVLGHLTTATPNQTTNATSTTLATTSVTNLDIHTALNQQNLTSNPISVTSNNTGLNTNPQQVTRLNIISSLPSVHTSVSNVQHTAGKPILSLATATLNKPLIINPATSVVQPSLVGNVMNMGNFNATSHQLKQSNTAVIPTVMALATLTTSSGSIPGRHTITSNSTGQQFNPISSSVSTLATGNSGQLIINSSNQATNLTQRSSNTTILTSQQSNSQHRQLTQSSTSNQQQQLNQSNPQSQPPLYTTIRSSNTFNSPIKQQLPQNTPASPRPSILIRKRVGTPLDLDSKMNCQSSVSSINSTSANIKSSQLNSIKQNLSLKYQNCASSNQPSTQFSNQSNVIGGSSSLKNAQEILNNTISSTVNKPSINLVNNSTKKESSINKQVIKNENELLKQENSNQLVNSGTLSNNFTGSDSLSINNNGTDNRQITPRKRRKQLLEPFMLTNSQNIKLLNEESNATNLLCNEELHKKDNAFTNAGYQNTTLHRPRPSLLRTYNLTWKSLQYHFLRHAEVKVKNDKKVSLQDLSNETLKKRNDWKVNHLSNQLQDILECEISFNRKLKQLSKIYGEQKNCLPPKVKELGDQPFNVNLRHNSISVLDKLNDLFAANVQRSNLIHDQIKDTNKILNKLSNDHKDKVNRMAKKFLNSKRNTSVKV